MKTLTSALVLSSLLFGTPVMAGSGHDHGYSQPPVNQVIAEKNADEVIASLVEREKIDKSWSTIKASSVDKQMTGNRPEWAVTYTNKEITDVEKQKLYVFLTIGGQYIAVNYTGK